MNGKLRNGQTKRQTGYGWMKKREAVLRLSPICYICKAKGKLTLATEVDHVIALINGGTNDMENLKGACQPCHQEKTRLDMGWKQKPEIDVTGWPVE